MSDPTPPAHPPSAAPHELAHLEPPSGRDTGIVSLSPRISPTPEPQQLVRAPGASTPFPLSAEPDADEGSRMDRTQEERRAEHDQRQLELVRAAAQGGEVVYSPAGRLSSLSGGAALVPDSPPRADRRRIEINLPPEEEDTEDEDQAALLMSSLAAGDGARSRRLSGLGRRLRGEEPAYEYPQAYPPRPSTAYGGAPSRARGVENEGPAETAQRLIREAEAADAAAGRAAEETQGGGGGDELQDDSGWVYIPSASLPAVPSPLGRGSETEVSPEEARVERMRRRARMIAGAYTSDDDDDSAGEWDEVAGGRREAAREFDRELGGVWDEMAERTGGGAGLDDVLGDSEIWRHNPLSIPRTLPLPRGGRRLQSRLPSLTAPSEPGTFSPANPPSSTSFSTSIPRLPWRSLHDTTENALPPPPPPAALAAGRDFLESLVSDDPPPGTVDLSRLYADRLLPRSNEPAPASPPQRRTREETNSLMGHALRAKKPVYLLYCGGGSGADSPLPEGFTAESASGGSGGGGCGALVCARALLDGVPGRIFSDPDARDGLEKQAAASDLPPHEGRVVDWAAEGGDAEGVGGVGAERVAKRGKKGCKGCLTRDVGCRRCGAHLGYRLLRPCVTCSISRPAYTNSLAPSSSSSTPSQLTLSAGGVTGGGLLDGLLFFFSLEAVTPVQRAVGVDPAEKLSGASEPWELEGESEEGRDGRLMVRTKGMGEGMKWRDLPTAQADFAASLISTPLPWLTPGGETWWLENAVAKHTSGRPGGSSGRKRPREEETGRVGGGVGVDAHSTDRLSTASTTVNSSTNQSSLTRSFAIRRRIPLAGSPSSSSTIFLSAPLSSSHADTAEADYDRYRADATTFERRVRRRLADPAAAADSTAAEGRAVLRGLEGAGYGTQFVEEEREESAGGLRRRRAGGRRESVGR
ncbi:hypothetical protein JCM10213_001093 [Rhodosporidiobolus nylandii]